MEGNGLREWCVFQRSATLADSEIRLFIHQQVAAGSQTVYRDTLRSVERNLLVQVLQHTGGNQLQAARILGITRGCLRKRIRDLGIRIARTVEGEES
jgi:two-component system nitrogen regulation response regulator GlnG